MRPVLAVETVQFHRWFAGFVDERLAISKGPALIGFPEMLEANPGSAAECGSQFEAFAVFPGKPNGINIPDAKRGQIVQNRSGAAGLAANVDNVVNRQAGLNREFLLA